MDDLIVVRGTATGRCPADRGVLRITARVKQPDPAAAERALAELTSAVDQVLDDFATVVSARRTEHLWIRPNSYWHPESGRTVVDGCVAERGVRMALSAGTEAAAEPTVDLGQAEIQVSASLDVGFRIEPGR